MIGAEEISGKFFKTFLVLTEAGFLLTDPADAVTFRGINFKFKLVDEFIITYFLIKQQSKIY